LDTAAIRGELEALPGRSITKPESILFLDEIQATPAAMPVLRYLYEDLPDLPITAERDGQDVINEYGAVEIPNS
jgi:predicted AAA+ superfamily ATPase